ncbi:MAG TPA: hypothetical protein VFO86_06930, partial [Terriglobia bacterium]|nr:hypothetical protein [Terriglobia bacterium]
ACVPHGGGRLDCRQFVVNFADHFEIASMKRFCTFQKGKPVTGYEYIVQKMVHPDSQGFRVMDDSVCRSGFKSIGIREGTDWKKRIGELKGVDELNGCHFSSETSSPEGRGWPEGPGEG